MRIRHVSTALLCIALAACASVPHQRPPNPRLARVEAVAGKPVGSIMFLGSLYSWDALDDQHVLLYTRPRDAYLLTVVPCPDLNSAISLGVTSQFSRITQGVDSVIAGNMGRRSYPCRIQGIRAVDVKALRAADTAARAAEKQQKVEVLPRPDAKPADDGH